MDNTILNHFYENNVKMRRDETKRVTKEVLPLVDELLRYVNQRDSRFLIPTVKVGSYHTHLKVERPDEFDFSVIVDVGKLYWSNKFCPRNYDFDKSKKNIESTAIALPNPPAGQCFIEYGSLVARWDSERLNDGGASMTFNNDIVPIKVKRRFKALIAEAVNQPKMRNRVTADRMSDSPAITLSITFPNISYPISIDLCPMIEASVEFKNEFNWPMPIQDREWPSDQKISCIKDIGIHVVAKAPFYWTLSFAACEKELLESIDENGTCRRKCLRILKTLKEKTWCNHNARKGLTSYHLKNVLFWECEYHPLDTEWQQELLATRVESMTYRLLGYLQRGNLPLYFHTGVNLLSSKDKDVLQQEMNNIVTFLNHPRLYLRG
ncbi:protein mab-21-like 3 [Pecten maximus]|uniref:protein mab-21-like 3 n=1 Tax=Pecten maximus TaxID=6579 RepID=UPI001458DE3E|nr:protein mab-21-like 3 [Pecten maximus]